ncbi:hypothetical protein B0A55_07286 [Friedmanniomyces simplex]|uniref:Spindle pole body component n=1 Tax=Friedmanniomyces simplex TaxID=329884 RepID=A0A4U0WQE4_9PEZI|nr:hypothetical protein B0A55_07286 [Friedmanniomyces simplex]
MGDVATSIQRHLGQFQQKILDVESKILTKAASVVGAYDIVPLALIVAEFDDWHRLMEWLWKTACLMQPTANQNGTLDAADGCSGATVINYLRAEATTGFPEIENASTELSRVAEFAWLRQLAPWVVYGKLPAYGDGDFFIQAEQGDGHTFGKTKNLMPDFLTYFLLGHGEFAVALIDEAETRLQARQQSMGRLLQQDPLKALQNLSIKDAELHQTLSSAWKRLAREEDAEDVVLNFARQRVRLSVPSTKPSRPASSESVSTHAPQISPIAFNDLLFPSATSLSLDIGPPLDLFISPGDIETYTAINAYLLAVRRAQVRLSELWRRTSARRDHAAKKKAAKRMRNTREVWATSSAALHLISETAAYLEGEVVKGSCDHFESWVEKPTSNEGFDESMGSVQSDRSPEVVAQRDPETLAAAHRTFAAALTYSLLLTDIPYTRELRSLLGNIDALIAFFNSLLDAQQKADLTDDASSGEDSYTVDEAARLELELDRARKKVDSDLRSVASRLRQLDHERIGSGRYLEVHASESGGFEPWRGGGVDRLLMKLEFGRMPDDARDLL